MTYRGVLTAGCAAIALAGVMSATPHGGQRGAPGPSVLSGTITANSAPIEGVAVSAKAAGSNMTTTVFTDDRGLYGFPPLPAGDYKVWAQATGFQTAKADAQVAVAAPTQNFTLQPIADITMQAMGSEWLAALPSATKDDRRMKEIFRANCVMCHSPAAVFQQRFDEQGWKAIIDLMLYINPPWSFAGTPDRHSTIEHYRDELARYLTRVSGPNSPPLKLVASPRPTGEATRVIITDWDTPVANREDGMAWFNGTDWSEGIATTGDRGQMLHDIEVDNYGNPWISAYGVDPIVKLDIKTGKTTGFRFKDASGKVKTVHGLARDSKGNIWLDAYGGLVRIDPGPETLEYLPAPYNMSVGPQISTSVDGKDKIWSSTMYGSILYDPVTKKWRLFQNVTAGDGFNYGNTADREGNGWWAQFNQDILGKGDPKTGKSYEVILHPPWVDKEVAEILTPDDKEYMESVGALKWGKINLVPGAQAPRRMGADLTGDTIWASSFQGNNVVGVDIHTLKPTYYRLPMEAHPYRPSIDNDHNVWTSVHSDDRMLKLNPKTGQWTVYRLPTLGCEQRHMTFDRQRNEVWTTCHRASKVIRIQFRRPDGEARFTPLPNQPAAVPTPGPTATRLDYDLKLAMTPSTLSERALRGRKLFTQRCAACHDPSERSTRTYGPRLPADRIKQMGDSAVRQKIAQGSVKMPGFRYMFNDEQTGLIIEYLQKR